MRAPKLIPQISQRGVGIDRPAEQEPLPATTAELDKAIGLRFFLNAFRNDIHAKPFAHGEDGTDDVLGRAVFENRGNEGAIDLQLVEVEFTQAAKRRLPGAEIIERNSDADAPQIVDDLLGRCRVAHQAGFGNLDFQPTGGQTPFDREWKGYGGRCSGPPTATAKD